MTRYVLSKTARSTFDPLTNDTDPDDDINPAAVVVFDPATNGVATAAAGKIRFTPTADYNGADTSVHGQRRQTDATPPP